MEEQNQIPTFRTEAESAAAAMLRDDATTTWGAIPLQEWDLLRETHFLLMRGVARAPLMSELMDSPGAFLADALRILWLCALDDDALRSAARSGMQAACDAWAAEHVPMGSVPAALRAGLRIYNDGHASDTEPVRNGDASPDDSLGE